MDWGLAFVNAARAASSTVSKGPLPDAAFGHGVVLPGGHAAAGVALGFGDEQPLGTALLPFQVLQAIGKIRQDADR